MEPTKVIKFEPWKGFEEEIYSGKKTRVYLFENRLEYKIEYIQKVTLSLLKGGEISGEPIVQDNFCKENGAIDKGSISAFVAYIETEYEPKTGEPEKVFKLDLSHGGTVLPFTFNKEEEQTELYNELHNWKYGQ